MSVKVMGVVWESALPQREKFILLAFADHADHEGKRVFPSVGLIAWKTGYTTRSIRRIVKTLVKKEYLVLEGKTKYGTKLYRIAMENLPKLPPYLGDDRLSGAKYGGDILSGAGVTKRQGEGEGGDNLTPLGVTNETLGGDTAMSPDPSLTIIKPSEGDKSPIVNLDGWLVEIKNSDNRNATLMSMFETLYPDATESPDFGYLGRVAKNVGGAGRLATLMWECSSKKITGDVMRYVQAYSKNHGENKNIDEELEARGYEQR